jgi:hypothetical protein
MSDLITTEPASLPLNERTGGQSHPTHREVVQDAKEPLKGPCP